MSGSGLFGGRQGIRQGALTFAGRIEMVGQLEHAIGRVGGQIDGGALVQLFALSIMSLTRYRSSI